MPKQENNRIKATRRFAVTIPAASSMVRKNF